jgi:NhaA family Na+:H+ antiporter
VGNPSVMFDRPTLPERSWVLNALRQETVGGALLLVATVIALVWANSPAKPSYFDITSYEIGPAWLHLHLSLSLWAADGLLAVFFFVAGLELKHELVLGSLSKMSQAALPIVAALAGMVVPALLFILVSYAMNAPQDVIGWGIPMATDIAFALAVLAVVGSRLPVALRAFLLTLAVVDDLGAIIVIAIFYGHGFSLLPFILGIVGVVCYGVLQHYRVRAWYLYVPLALVTWTLIHASGVHATVAGIALGLLTRVRPDPGESHGPAERLEHRIRPFVVAFCIPIFAFMAAGVDVVDEGASVLTSPIAIAVIVGLVVGKPLGVFGGSWLVARFTRASLPPSLKWLDILTVGLLAGIGFTVSLLVSELAFPAAEQLVAAKTAVLFASLLAALLASIALLYRSRAYRLLAESEETDIDGDGIPDVYQTG